MAVYMPLLLSQDLNTLFNWGTEGFSVIGKTINFLEMIYSIVTDTKTNQILPYIKIQLIATTVPL